MSKENCLKITDESQMEKFGGLLAAKLPIGSVVALDGTLGAGKTRLVQAVCNSLNIPQDQVTSPTFTLVQEYQGDKKVYHLDAYRIADIDEFEQLGVSEIFSADALIFVEWAEKVPESFPRNHYIIKIEITGQSTREISISATKPDSQAVVTEITNAFAIL